MAAPNLITTSSIIGKTKAEWVPSTLTAILTNPVNSSQSYRINVLYVTNLSASDSVATVDLFRNAVSYKLASGVPVPVANSLVVSPEKNAFEYPFTAFSEFKNQFTRL